MLITPFAFGLLGDAYVALVQRLPDSVALVTALRWLLAFLVVVVPTTAMGATLPLLSRLTVMKPIQVLPYFTSRCS